MLVIRLRRTGKKNKPSYRVVVAEHSFPIDGRFVEDLGFYNPHNKENNIDTAKALEWMKKGAKPSNIIAKILEKAKIKHISVVVTKKNRKPKTAVVEKPAAAPTAQTNEIPENSQDEETEPTEVEEGSGEKDAETPPTDESVPQKNDS